MVSDGIKAARIQAQYSPLINSTWSPGAFQTINVLSAIRHAAARLNPNKGGRRPAGRHAAPGRRAAPGRSPAGRHAPRRSDF